MLAELRQSGFDRYLKDNVQDGRPIYGGSAGAAVLGRDIRTVDRIDRNEAGLADTSGLDLAAGHSVWVHYTAQDDDAIAAYFHQYQHPVLAISERAGIVLDEAGLRSVGFEAGYRFDQNGKTGIKYASMG